MTIAKISVKKQDAQFARLAMLEEALRKDELKCTESDGCEDEQER